MNLLSWMQPRDHASAARTVSVLSAVAVAVTVVFAPIAPATGSLSPRSIALASGIMVLVGVLAWTARFFDEASRLAWALCPLLAVAAIVLVDLLTLDASVSAQIFLLFPTLYGASALRRSGAVVMTSACLVGEVVVVASHLPIREALTDIGYVAAVLVTVTVLLVRAGERQAELVARLEQQAALDPLTGLVTRRVLDEAAATALTGAGSDAGTSLILLDIDNFKTVNDRYGHPGGDQALVQMAELLGKRTRPGDVVCRMGGDEMALLLPGCSQETALRRAESIIEDVRCHRFVLDDGMPVQLSVSVGLAQAPTHALDLRTLYATADAALYQAKRTGRDRVAAPSLRR
jgi:diguanylate cyclase (GGDEF)-like protein